MKTIKLTCILVLLTIKTFGQNHCTNFDELFRKRHKIANMTYGHPYTTFDRHNGLSFEQTIQKIRDRIVLEKNDSIRPIFDAYQALYSIATQTSGMPTDNGMEANKTVSPLAVYAKNCAFVFLIGLDGNGNTIDIPSRNAFRDKALNAFENLDGEIDGNAISPWSFFIPVVGAAVVPYNVYNREVEFYSKMQGFTRSLVMWLQAYDLLKAAYEVPELRIGGHYPWGFGDADRNSGDCSPRNKLRKYTRDIYKYSEGDFGITEHALGWKKNHGIAAASAVLMAAQVLNDAGVETNYVTGLFGWLWGDGFNIPRPNYSPINWNKLGQNGLDDNLFVGKHKVPYFNPIGFPNLLGGVQDIVIKDVPQSPRNQTPNSYSVYAEGTDYAYYGLFDCGIPAMITQRNLFPNWSNEPFIKKNEIINIFNWYNNLLSEDNTQPSIDNSKFEKKGILAITGIKEFNRGIGGLAPQYYADYVAMVGGNNIPLNTNNKPSIELMGDAGNLVLRNSTKDAKHTFYMLFEKDIAVDGTTTDWADNHEDDDMGSFSFMVKDKDKTEDIPLAIDPPYTGWEPAHGANTNKYWMHNTIEIDDGQPAKDREYIEPNYSIIDEGKFTKIQQFNLSYAYASKTYAANYFPNAIKRNVNAINNSENFYYFINDYVDVSNISLSLQYIKLNLNGNGNKESRNLGSSNSSVPLSFRKTDNLYRWTYPCGDSWSLTAHVSVLANNIKPYWEDYHTKTASVPSEYDRSTMAYGISGGILTRLRIHQPVKKTIFQSFLYPQRCGDSLPTVTKDETADYVTTKIRFINSINTDSITARMGKIGPPNKYINDTASHFHFARWQGGIADSVTNPFNLPAHSNIKLYLDAKKAFVKRNTFGTNMFGYKYCPSSVINTRFASIENGSYLKYNDTFLIKATIQADISISFFRRQEYTCFFNPLTTPSASDTIQFYLADVSRGVEMVAVTQWDEIIPSRYDSLKRMIYVEMPAVKTTFFLQEKESCKNCYFPQTWLGVVDTFEIDNETYNKLGNKLTVKQPNGLLKITKSSSITMCEGMYLQNKNNLIIEGPCQTKAYERKTCKGIDSMVAAYSQNSAIVVSPFSALVLEPGSHTYIKNGGAIYVKANGSLIIKSGAFVQIGDSGTCNQGWGEIVAEPGSYIHIIPGAHIEYRKTIGDTVDRNFILIPTAAGLLKANEGVHYAIKSILQDDAILPDTTFPFFTYPICGLDTTSPIINKEWGYTSFGKPYATFQARNDTLCPGEPLHISLNRILNDARYQIKVCRMDSFQVTTALGGRIWQDTCIMDTIVQDEILPDPVCKEPRNTPGDWTYYFNPGTLHRVTISVWNECGDIDDSIAYIYTALPPDVTINVPETACEGIGTVNATVNVTPNQVYNYAIEVTEKMDTSSLNYKNGTHSESYSQSYNGFLPPTINFGNYFFKGGSTYLISLSVANDCGTYTVYDSVSIPLGASVNLTRPTVYGNNISGATAVQLNGMVLNADSFRWEPTTWLDTATSLTPISTPTDSITYVLIAKGGACTATDTAHIKYNRFANAGYSDTLCSNNGTAILLGFPYDMSLFLGMLYYYDNAQFMSYYNSHNITNAPDYFRYFTHFMHTDNFKNSAISCPIDLYNLFNNTLHKQIFFSTSWYRGYYMQFSHFNSLSLNALDIFADQVLHNSSLKDHLDSLNNWGNIDPCINNILNLYDDYLQNHAGEISTTWSKITGNDTSSLSSWNNFFVAENAPLKSSTYLLSVITPDRAEIDEITILVDTTLTPLFAPAMQFDSTVFFMNYTEPVSSATTYEWNFGDGSANSNEQNPIHTFPAFDTSYIVCLTASNKCNSWQYCDTVYIDSLHLGGTLKTANKPAFFETNISTSLNDRLALSNKLEARGKELVALQNYPNPFNQSTIIDYQIWQSFSQAELRITNILGQILYTQKLQKPIDKVEIDGSNLANGLYYYSIVVDNSIKLTKTMSVIH